MAERCMIIGLGKIGMGYDLAIELSGAVYTHARSFLMHPAFELVGAVDPAAAQRDTFSRYYGQPAYPDIASALQAQAASVVVIAAPTAQHCQALKEVLAYSCPKVILCEKPLAYGLVEARAMVEACDNAGVKLFVNYMRRADPGAIEIKERIESGQIAGPLKGVVWYSKGFLHNGSHFFNLLEFWLGSFLKAEMLDAGRLWNNQDPEPDVQVEFQRGKVVFIAAWEEAFSHCTVELLSPAGRLRYEQGGESIAWQSTHADLNVAGRGILRKTPEMVANGMDRYQWHVAAQLANALVGKPHTLCSGRQALVTLEAMHQIINQR